MEVKNKHINTLGYKLFIYTILPEELILKDEKLDVECFCEDIHNEDKLFEFLHSIYEEYTLKPTGWLLVLDNDKLIGRCALFIRDIKYEGQDYKLGGIGGLAVQKKYRRKGIASALVKESENFLIDAGCDFSMFGPLDDELVRYYKNLGYVSLSKPYFYVGRSGNRYTKNYGVIKYFINSPKIEFFKNSHEPVDIGNYDY